MSRVSVPAAVRLIRLELRHSAMLAIMPLAVALFWFITYRKAAAMPPFWYLRAETVQTGAVADFIVPVVGAAAWIGSREARTHASDLVEITARSRIVRLLLTWAAATCWALLGYLICLAAVYVTTAQHVAFGGPLWWPAVVAAASLPALSAIGFVAGTLLPSRFTAPMAGLATFFAVALSTELIRGSHSFWQISPVVSHPWDIGPDAGVATFYPYVPDLSIAQLMFLVGLTIAVLAALALRAGSGGRLLRSAALAVGAAGLVASGTAVALAGTGTLDSHGMITIPALHDAAVDRPIRVAQVCGSTAIPVCLNPAYARYLPAVAAALRPVLDEVAGLPGAPVRISQVGTTYLQEAGNSVAIGQTGPILAGNPPVYHLLLPDQLFGSALTAGQMAGAVRANAGPAIVAAVVGDGPGASPAQNAVGAGLQMAAGKPVLQTSGAIDQAAQRFAALSAPVRRAWLIRHLAALRRGQIKLAQLP